MCVLGSERPETSAKTSHYNIITPQNTAHAVANNLEKGADLFACPPELVITQPRAPFASQIHINSLC